MLAESKRMAHALQGASDELCMSLSDRPIIGVTKKGRICMNARLWTSAMAYQHIYFDWSPRYIEEILGPTSSGFDWDAVAPSLMQTLLGPTIRLQEDRWLLARMLGLVVGDRIADLPSDDMMVDRTMAGMLHAKGIDIRRAAALVDIEEPVVGDELPLVMAGVNLDEPLCVRQIGTSLPVIGGWIRIGRACYDGTVIQLNGPVPDTIMAAAAGRRLGDVVRTGIASIDDRRILSFGDAWSDPFGFTTWHTGMDLEIQLSPDHVRLGDIPRLPKSRRRAKRASRK
jgi:hypothetical protein